MKTKQKRSSIGRAPTPRGQVQYPFDPFSEEAQLPFAEQMLLSPEVPSAVKGALRSSFIIDATPVSDYFYCEADKDNWSLTSDFPHLAPPYEAFFLEFNAPKSVRSHWHESQSWPKGAPTAWGLLCYGENKEQSLTRALRIFNDSTQRDTIIRDQDEKCSATINMMPHDLRERVRRCTEKGSMRLLLQSLTGHHRELVDQLNVELYMLHRMINDNEEDLRRELDEAYPPGVAWHITIRIFVRWKTQKGIVCGECVGESGMAICSDGAIYCRDGNIPAVSYELLGELAERELYLTQKSHTGWDYLRIIGVLGSFLYPGYLALSFLHCKNVAVLPKPDKKELQYHTLDIRPMRQTIAKTQADHHASTKQALHICRGHFRSYENGRGLFGKYKGTYWIPQHVRGQ